MKVLITGFDAFADVSLNHSEVVSHAIAEDPAPLDVDIQVSLLPTAYRRAGATIEELLTREAPDIALSLGVATSPSIRLEQFAIN